MLGCSLNERDLGGGYRLVQLSGTTSAIINQESELVVYPNVVSVRVEGNFVYGRRVMATDNANSQDPRFSDGLGDFRLNLTTGQLDHIRVQARSDDG
jgi:hypothetical protein